MRVALLVFVACATVEPVTPPPSPPADVAPLAALEAMPDLDGTTIGRAANQPTIVVVFASWCGNCHTELAELAQLRAHVRVLGLNYTGHEEYDGRGNPEALRAYVAKHAPWLRVILADEQLFERIGSPPKIPTLYVYDRGGALVTIYDRRERGMPDAAELRALLKI